MKKLISLALVLAMVFALGITASASSESMQKELTYRGISIVVDGEKINPLGAGGVAVEPFIMDNTTYLPLRAVGYAFGLDVGWDAETYTVTLTRGAEQKQAAGEAPATFRTVTGTIYYNDIKIVLDGKEITPVGAGGVVAEPFIYNGTTYLPVRAISNALGVDVGWDNATSTVSLDGEWAYLCTTMVSDLGEKYDYTYGAYGNVIKEKVSYVDGGVQETNYTYDEFGRLLLEEGEYYRYEYTYDARGNMLSEKYSVEGELMYAYYYEYDANDNLLAYYDGYYGEPVLSKQYTYNADGKPATYKYYYDGENGYYLTTYAYDPNGNCLSEIEEDYYEGEVVNVCYTYYEYDEEGRMVFSQYISEYSKWEEHIAYEGNLTIINYSNSDGWKYTQENQFDDEGYHLGYSCIYGNGDSEYMSCEYDEYGDVVFKKYSYVYADGSADEYECTYFGNGWKEYNAYSDGSYRTSVVEFNEYGDITSIYADENGYVYEETCEYTYAWVLI